MIFGVVIVLFYIYKACPFIFATCYKNTYDTLITPMSCREGIGRSTDKDKRCACEVGYHENIPVTANCVPDC